MSHAKKIEAKEFNFLVGDWEESDKDLFFGPLDKNDNFVIGCRDMPEILAIAGVFASKNVARKNGWDAKTTAIFKWSERHACCLPDKLGMEIPNGFTCFVAGKGKQTKITILKV